MKLYKTRRMVLLNMENQYVRIPDEWDSLLNRPDLHQYLQTAEFDSVSVEDAASMIRDELLPPIGTQEIWASGVTYYRSREARMDEAKKSGGSDFYDRVYDAERPELFFKATPHRVAGSGEAVRIRKDSHWNVPEPELTLLVNAAGKIIGYTVGNDMSSRDIEGENPLYLPQAKTYDRSAAIGPCLFISESPLSDTSVIGLEIWRDGVVVFQEEIALNQMKRKPDELVRYLYRESSFPAGCFLMTGTGIVPPNDFTLQHEDEIRITIEPIGTLVNVVE
ncbi:MAG: fumarylacetoacetate hydrolase family protein [Balneolaceae bacterium]